MIRSEVVFIPNDGRLEIQQFFGESVPAYCRTRTDPPALAIVESMEKAALKVSGERVSDEMEITVYVEPLRKTSGIQGHRNSGRCVEVAGDGGAKKTVIRCVAQASELKA
ncbi:hypothetical protein U1Q18_005832 [Sarracenia purpurea var. burkii]